MNISNRPYLLLTFAVLFWAGNFVLGRAFHTQIPPVALAFWRWVGATLLVLIPATPYFLRDRKLLVSEWPIVLLLATFGIAAFNTLAYTGLQYTQAINALLIQSLMPVLIVIMSFLIFREKVILLQGVGIVVSLCGALVIVSRGSFADLWALSFNHGDLLVLAAIVCYATYSVMLRKRPHVHPLSFILTTFLVGSIILLPIYLWETFTVARMPLQWSSFLVVGYVAIFPSIVSYLCYNRGVELIGANRAGLFIHLIPVFGSIMAILFLDERLAWFHGVGILLIGFGIYLATRTKPDKMNAFLKKNPSEASSP